MDPAPGPGIMARSPRRIYSRGGSGGGGGCGRAWRPPGVRQAAGAPGGPAPSPSSTSSLACRSGAPPPWLPARRSLPTARAPRSRGNLWHPRHPAPAAAAVAPARRPAGPRSPPRGWVSGRGTRAWEAPGRGAVGAELGPPPHANGTLAPQAHGCHGRLGWGPRRPCPWPCRLEAPGRCLAPAALAPSGARGATAPSSAKSSCRRWRRSSCRTSTPTWARASAWPAASACARSAWRWEPARWMARGSERIPAGWLSSSFFGKVGVGAGGSPWRREEAREAPGRQWDTGPVLGRGWARHVRESVAGTGGEVQLVFVYFVLNFYFSWW